MSNKIVQLKDKTFTDNIYPIAGGMAADSITTQMLKDNSVTSDKVDSATLDMSTITPASGYSWAGLSITRIGEIVYFAGAIQTPAITSLDNQTVAFTLPSGWRPKSISNFLVISWTGASTVPLARVRLGTDGTVKISKIDQDLGNGAYTQMAPISYLI